MFYNTLIDRWKHIGGKKSEIQEYAQDLQPEHNIFTQTSKYFVPAPNDFTQMLNTFMEKSCFCKSEIWPIDILQREEMFLCFECHLAFAAMNSIMHHRH